MSDDARPRRTRSACAVVVEAEHRAPRQIGTAGLDVIARRGRGRLQVQHRDAVDDRKDAALAAEDAVLDLVAGARGETAT